MNSITNYFSAKATKATKPTKICNIVVPNAFKQNSDYVDDRLYQSDDQFFNFRNKQVLYRYLMKMNPDQLLDLSNKYSRVEKICDADFWRAKAYKQLRVTHALFESESYTSPAMRFCQLATRLQLYCQQSEQFLESDGSSYRAGLRGDKSFIRNKDCDFAELMRGAGHANQIKLVLHLAIFHKVPMNFTIRELFERDAYETLRFGFNKLSGTSDLPRLFLDACKAGNTKMATLFIRFAPWNLIEDGYAALQQTNGAFGIEDLLVMAIEGNAISTTIRLMSYGFNSDRSACDIVNLAARHGHRDMCLRIDALAKECVIDLYPGYSPTAIKMTTRR